MNYLCEKVKGWHPAMQHMYMHAVMYVFGCLITPAFSFILGFEYQVETLAFVWVI